LGDTTQAKVRFVLVRLVKEGKLSLAGTEYRLSSK